MNVAADPMFTWAYMGVNGGNVIVTADEPGMFSSQNEQDNRNYAKAAKIAMMEPSDSQECIDMVKAAYDLGEEFDTPFIIRMTTRVCHSKSIVELTDRAEQQPKIWEKNPAKYVCLPAIARKLRVNLEKRMEKLAAYSETTPFNRMEMGDTRVGVIAVPVYFLDGCEEVFVEVQLRTVAMDFWASLEHQLRYKQNKDISSRIDIELKACAEVSATLDRRMQKIFDDLNKLD